MKITKRTGSAWGAMAALVAVPVVLSACATPAAPAQGPSGSGPESTGTIEAATAEYESLTGPITDWPTPTAIENPASLEGKTVWYIPMVGAIPTMATIGTGLSEAVEQLGGTTKVCDGQGIPTAVSDCLRQAKSQGAAAVVTAYVDYAIASTPFEELADAGIPVLIGGVAPSPDRPADDTLAYFEQEIYNGEIFELAANAVVSEHGADTNVLWIRAADTPTTQRSSDMGMAKFEELCSDCEMTSIDASTPQLDKLASEVSAALVKAPGVNTIFVPLDAYVPTVTQGIAGSGRNGQLTLVATGGDLAGLQRIAGGQQTADLGVPPIFTGWSFAHALMQHMSGAEVEMQKDAVVRFFNSDNVGELTLDNESYASPDWYGDNSYEDKFLSAWGIG